MLKVYRSAVRHRTAEGKIVYYPTTILRKIKGVPRGRKPKTNRYNLIKKIKNLDEVNSRIILDKLTEIYPELFNDS